MLLLVPLGDKLDAAFIIFLKLFYFMCITAQGVNTLTGKLTYLVFSM